MKKLLLIVRYIKYWVRAKTRYRIHSQFVFDFINNILRDKQEYREYSVLWEHRNEVAASRDSIETVDFGAASGSKTYSTKYYRLGKLFVHVLIPNQDYSYYIGLQSITNLRIYWS